MTSTTELRGSRWLHIEPSPQDVREWFDKQPLHDGMTHDRYASGVVLIPAAEKYWHREPKPGNPEEGIDIESYRKTWTPYVSVSTRVNYFHDYVRLLNGGRIDGPFKGRIRPVRQCLIEEGPLANVHLPKGFSLYAVQQGGALVPYVVCTMRVQIIERRSKEVLIGAEDSRQIPAGDQHAIAKARTSAVGRALGLAGMLVIGTGVASAEEAQDAVERTGALPAYQQAQLPGDVADTTQTALTEADLRGRVRTLYAELSEAHEGATGAFNSWYGERKFGPMDSLGMDELRTVVKKLERDLDQAKGGSR